MKIPSGSTDRYVYFVALDATDLKTRETGLSGFSVRRSRNGGASAAFTTPTINETDSANMPGVYELLLDEDTTLAAGHDTEELCLHITCTGMAPVTRVIEIYRPKFTEGETGTLSSSRVAADATAISGDSAAADNLERWFDGTVGFSTSGSTFSMATFSATNFGAEVRTAVGLASANLDTQLADLPTNAELTAALAAADDPVLAQVALVKSKTDNLPVDPADQSAVEAAIAAAVAGLSTLTAAEVNAQVDTALADVGLTLVVTGRIDAAISTRLATAGYTVPLDAAGIRTAVGLGSANLDTQLGDLPTNAELAAATAGLSTLTAAQVNAQVDVALADVGLTTVVTGRIDTAISTRLAAVAYSAPLDASGIRSAVGLASADLDTQLAAIAAKTTLITADTATAATRILTTLEADGEVFRFTNNALEQAPTGGGGGSSLTQQDVRDALKLAPSAGAAAAGSIDAKLDAVSAAGGSGAFPITVTVTDGAAPIQNAIVRVTEGATTHTAFTNADGQAEFPLDAGTYRVGVTKSGYTFTPVTRTVTGIDAGTLIEDLEMELVVIPPPPADAGVCHVFGYLETPDNQPAEGITVIFDLVAPELSVADVPIAERRVTATTDSEGRLVSVNAAGVTQLYVPLQRNDLISPAGSTWKISCVDLRIWERVVTLDTETFDLASLLEAE